MRPRGREIPHHGLPDPPCFPTSRGRVNRTACAGAHWAPGSLRDAFCSYHLSHFGSIDRLIQEAGHTSLRTTKDHYLGLVSAEAAAEFWDLLPPGEKGKIIQLAG
jgi:hypothetical protein